MATCSVPKISERAVTEIRAIWAEQAGPDMVGSLPCIVWVTESSKEGFIPGPMIGSIKRDIAENFSDLSVECHGLKIWYDFPEDVLRESLDKILDFDGRGFFLTSSESQ